MGNTKTVFLKPKGYNHDFWQPLVMTYTMTIGFVIAIWLIQYSADIYKTGWIFYGIDCKRWLLFLLAKVAENLIPTTIVFGFTILASMRHKVDTESFSYTALVTLLFLLGMIGCVFLVAKKIAIFYIALLLIYTVTFLIIKCLESLMVNSTIPSQFKSEKSDGKY